MKILIRILLLASCWLTLSSWGFYAHRIINRTAIFLLPPELSVFYKKNIKQITEQAIDPDKRCYIDSLEPARHYIDLNEIDKNTDSIPIHWTKAIEKYNEQKLRAHGIVPWQIAKSYNNLVQAFKNKDKDKIIKYSSDLGHYIADAHVPLHTTSNYNGQFTNQIGIHAFWETRLPEMFVKRYNLFIGAALYIENPLEKAWQIIKESNALVDSVLNIEKELSITFKKTEIKAYIERNNQLVLTYSDQYATAYHNALNGMVEKRLTSAILRVSSLWYSAWVDAGQPQLNDESIFIKKEEKNEKYLNGKSLGREEWH